MWRPLSALTGSRVFRSSKVAVVGVFRGEVIGGSFGVVWGSPRVPKIGQV